MAIVQFTVVPLGTGGTSLSGYVAQVQKVLEVSGLTQQLLPMGTILEGPLDRILEVIRQAHEVPFENGAQRVMTLINIDDRRDKQATAQDKVASVRRKLDQA
jgi:uncharacterized protein (TIGR00106 family)